MISVRLLLLIMASLAISQALVVGPMIYEQKDMGDIGLKEFVYSMSADCTAGTITITVMNSSYMALGGANTYLQYTQFSSQILSSVQTDPDGVALHKLPGNVKLMQGLFIMVIEKYGYRNKEIHFDLSPCFSNGTKPPKPVTPPKNQTANQTKPANQSTQINITQNNRTNSTQNITGNTTGSGTQSSICPSAMLIAVLASGGGIAALMARRLPPRISRRYKSYKK